jgi:hypothetical protein
MTTKPMTKPTTTTTTPMHRHAPAATTTTTPHVLAGRRDLKVTAPITCHTVKYALGRQRADAVLANHGPATITVSVSGPIVGHGLAVVSPGGHTEIPRGRGGFVLSIDVVKGTGAFANIEYDDWTT